MIAVIKHGKKFKPVYKICCYKCHCVFTYNDSDITRYANIGPFSVICPECHCWLRHEYRDIYYTFKNGGENGK